MIYFVYLVLLILLLTIERSNKVLSKYCRIIIPVLYTLFIGLRGKYVGVDTETYYEHYYMFGQWGCDFVEPGFDKINTLCFSMGWGANSLFLICAAITCFFLYLALNRLGKEYTVAAFFLYLFTFAFLVNGMRQGIACAIFVYAYHFIVERKWFWYIPCILVASLFHVSVLLLLLIYLLRDYSLNNKIYVLLYICSFVGLFFDLSSYLPQIELGNRDYSGYAENVKISQASSLGFIVTTFLNVVILSLILRNKLYQKYPLLVNLVFIAFCLKNLGYNLPIIGRLTIYFSWFVFLLYPVLYYNANKFCFKSKQITILIILLINAAVWINSLFSSANKLMPYLFYWEKSFIL